MLGLFCKPFYLLRIATLFLTFICHSSSCTIYKISTIVTVTIFCVFPACFFFSCPILLSFSVFLSFPGFF